MVKLLISDGSEHKPSEPLSDCEVWTTSELKRKLKSPAVLLFFFRYSSVTLLVNDLLFKSRPFLRLLTMRFLTAGKCQIVDRDQKILEISFLTVLWQLVLYLRDLSSLPATLLTESIKVKGLLRSVSEKNSFQMGDSNHLLYLKTDFWFSQQIGGSSAHMAGVLNQLSESNLNPRVYGIVNNQLLNSKVSVKNVLPENRYFDFLGVPSLLYSQTIASVIWDDISITQAKYKFIYHRYSFNNFAGVLVSSRLKIPLILEYNGSEVWIEKNWGVNAGQGKLPQKIEMLNLQYARLIVTVSEQLKKELCGRGLESTKIIVCPNGVDTSLFNPNIQPFYNPKIHYFKDKIVFGFLGTFGPWHGTDLLVESFAKACEISPDFRINAHLIMIGDGVKKDDSFYLARELGIIQKTTFTGLVSQANAPQYLANCDVLICPTLPNPDGSDFFGSPVKIFEYLAMGKPIIASSIGQIPEFIEHGVNGFLVEPGDSEALTRMLLYCEKNSKNSKVLKNIGLKARELAETKCTWKHHVDKILAGVDAV